MPLKNSLGVERRVDLASLFCMIGRHGPAVALALIAMVSVLAGFVIYRNVRGKRRKAEVDAGGETRDGSVMGPEMERRSAPLTDESDDDPSDVPREPHLIQSDFTARRRHIEKAQPSPGNDVVKPAAKKVQTGDPSGCERSFFRGGDVHAESVRRDDRKESEKEMEEVAGGWTAWWTSGSRADECGTKETQRFVDERGSEKQIQKEEGATRGSDTSDNGVYLQEENKFELVSDKRTCVGHAGEDVVKHDSSDHMMTSELLREEQVVSCKDDDCDEESNQVNTEEKSISCFDANAVEITSVEPDESESLLPQDPCGREASLKNGDWGGTAELLTARTEQQDDCMNGEQVNVGSFVQDRPCIALDQTSAGACVSDIQPGHGQLVEDNENSDLQRTSDGTEDEPVNGLTMSDEEHDAHVMVPPCDLNPEPAEDVSNCEGVVPSGSIAYTTASKVEEEQIAHRSLAANGAIPTIVLHEVSEDVCRARESAYIPVENADSENSKSSSDSKENEPKSKDDSTAMLEPNLDQKSEPSVGETSESAAFEEPLPTAICPDQPNADLKTESNVDEGAGGDWSATGMVGGGASMLDGSERGLYHKKPDVNMNVSSCEGHLSKPIEDSLNQSVDPEPVNCDANCTAVEEASASLDCERRDQRDDDMDWNTSAETCANVVASETPEELPSDVSTPYPLTSHTESCEDFAGLVTAEFSAMTVNIAFPFVTPHDASSAFGNEEGLAPTVSVISETQVTEMDFTELQVTEPQSQTALYADDVAVYVAKVENKLESYAANEDTLGHEIEDSYYELVEKLMVHISSTIATLTDELTDTGAVADLDEKKEGGSSEKKDGSKEKNDDDEEEEEVHEKTEISIMEATMDHNEWITDGSYQTLPWMNLPIQTKTDQPPTVEHLQRSLTDNTSMDVDVTFPTDAKQTGNPGLVDENTDNSKKIVAVQPMPQNVNIKFRVHYVTHSPHHTVAITGNQEELGNWKEFIPLEREKDGHWAILRSLPAESLVEWKFVVVEEGAVCRWEECGNRLLDTGCGDDILVHKCWGFL